MSKIGRNDPCPCGSGKKYKKCCMMKEEASDPEPDTSRTPPEEQHVRRYPPARAAEIENAFRRAINQLDRNEFEQAAKTFESVVRLDPEHYKALTGLGRCLKEIGVRDEARRCFQKALEIKPDYAQARLNLEL